MKQMGCNDMASPFFPTNFFMQNSSQDEEHHLSPPPSNPLLSSNLQDFRGMVPMLGKRPMSLPLPYEETTNEGEEDLSDDCSHVGEKKRRLNIEQVRTLEKNFELGNKLEPERKMQLARALGLQPRQIAIWFQNRRARWKTKQLEKDYDVLKRQFDSVKSENESLQAQNKKLQAEIMALKGRSTETSELINLNKETEASCSNNSSEINLDTSRTPPTESRANPQNQHGFPFYPGSIRVGEFEQLIAQNGSRPSDHQLIGQNGSRQSDHHQLISQNGSRPSDHHQFQCAKVEPGVHEPNFSNLLCTMEEHPPFWPWADHPNFH
ncbi:hypothetical protein LUZ60_005777 [Juncus effusus]|nr:hypothetical protein LUZ60_005777 [Juncus effusus]